MSAGAAPPPTTSAPELARLLAPVEPERFFAEHWERAPLALVGEGPARFAGLLALDDLDRLLAEGGLQYPGLRLVRDGKPLPRQTFVEDVRWGDGTFREAIVVERVLAEHRAGATVVFQALHRRFAPLARLCRALERRLACRFQTNVYLTPAGERGLGIHADRHDVFVLQVHGSKEWTVWDRPAGPGESIDRLDVAAIEAGEPLHRLTLAAGDLLYLPRGFPHRAVAREEPSAHVALGAVPTTWGDVLEAALAAARRDPELRRSLPAGALVDRDAWPALESTFRDVVGRFARRFEDEARLAPALDRLATRFAHGRTPIARGRLAAIAAGEPALAAVTAASRLVRDPRVVAHLRPARRERSAGAGDGSERSELVELVFHGKRVVFPAAARPALERMESGEPFVVGELPGAIDDASRIVVARRLLAEGYLAPADG